MKRRQWLTVLQAAEWLGVEERFVRRLVAERRVVFYKVGRNIRFDVLDLEEFLAQGKVEKSGAA